MRRSLKQVDVKQLYNPMPQEVRVSRRSEFGVSGCSSKQWEPDPAESWAAPLMRKKCCYRQKSWWSICCSLCSVSNSPLTHNPFRTISNKVWEVYFSKELCPFVIIVLTIFLHAYEYVTQIKGLHQTRNKNYVCVNTSRGLAKAKWYANNFQRRNLTNSCLYLPFNTQI